MISAPTKCVEFGLRRAQGPSAGILASKYSFIGGFQGSSNVYGAYMSGIPCVGTMAHSLIMSFEKESDINHCKMLGEVDMLAECYKVREELGWQDTNLGELYAFISFAHSYPDAFSALIDSYHTINSGIKNYLIVSIVLKQNGKDARGIRLDSGDLP